MVGLVISFMFNFESLVILCCDFFDVVKFFVLIKIIKEYLRMFYNKGKVKVLCISNVVEGENVGENGGQNSNGNSSVDDSSFMEDEDQMSSKDIFLLIEFDISLIFMDIVVILVGDEDQMGIDVIVVIMDVEGNVLIYYI